MTTRSNAITHNGHSWQISQLDDRFSVVCLDPDLDVDGVDQTTWPDDATVSEWFSRAVEFADSGDSPLGAEGIYQAAPRRTARVLLASGGMGDNATEADYDSWTVFVADNIDAATGLDVTVEQGRFGAMSTDILYVEDEDRDTLHEAIQELWQRWCSEAAAPAIATQP